jgi:hypothetical protein
LAGLIFGHPQVVEVFDQRDVPTGEAAEASVDEEETDEAEAADLQRAEEARGGTAAHPVPAAARQEHRSRR